MPRIVGLLGTRQGAGATVRTVSLAFELAKTHEVMLIDLDGAGGTAVDFLQLPAEEVGQRSVGNFIALPQIPGDAIQEQAIRVKGRERLRVVPAVRTGCGPTVMDILPRIWRGLEELPDELVLIDLGVPLSYPGQRSVQAAGKVLNEAFQGNKVIFLWDDPFTLAVQIAHLRLAALNGGQIVITSQYRKLSAEARRILAKDAPDLAVKLEWPWTKDVWRQPLNSAAQAKFLGLSG